MGVSLDTLTLSALTVVVFVVSILLSYLLVSMIAAISGAACGQLEEVDSANTTAMLLVIGGYLLSTVLIAFDGAGAVWFSVLCPGVSAFAAPIRYLLGDVPAWGLLISWALQLVILWFLARLSAKVYRDMMLYQGKRLQWKDIFRMARQSKGKGDVQ
jgi:ABC-type Na+ efflux pump permease subunit